ncbi:MAG: arginine N-succinyltransferase [Pseudomonadota bacterium]
MTPSSEKNADDKPGLEDLLIRPATSSDVDDFYELARLAGAGFTSLPMNKELLSERLVATERAFAGLPGVLMLALEDQRSKTVIGCAAVKPGGEPRPHFLNFQVSNDGQTLTTTAKYDDMTEVGSLLLHPEHRAFGVGPWLARSRYLLIAADVDRFGDQIFSELRGVVNEDDRSPFYDGVCARYFDCSFADADELCAHGLQADLNVCLPQEPIAIADISSDARKAMGRPHNAGRRALDYLEREGFRFDGVVDLLDGGPAVVARTREIKTVRSTITGPLRRGQVDLEESRQAYLSVGDGAAFRCCRAPVAFKSGAFHCSDESMALLEASEGASSRVCFVDDHAKDPDARKTPSALAHERSAASLDAVTD